MQRSLRALADAAQAGYRWLRESVPDALASTLREDDVVLASLAASLPRLARDREVVLVDRDRELVLARLDRPGSVFETLRRLEDRSIAASEIFHSAAPVPGTDRALEVHRYEFDGDVPADAAVPAPEAPPREVVRAVRAAASARGLRPRALDEALGRLRAEHPRYVRLAPAADVAELAWLLHECRARGGSTLDLVETGAPGPATVLFAVASPPSRGFLMQVTEVFNALDVGMRRAIALSVTAGGQRFFLGSFRLAHRKGEPLGRGSELFRRLRREILASQLLDPEAPTYRDFVLPRVMSTDEAGLVNAFIGFCHTNCAHNQIESYTYEDVVRAFHFHPEMSLRLVRLFETRFDPDRADREATWARELEQVEREVAAHNTGHRLLDDFRRSLFRTALLFVKHCLKTNFFVDEKQALAFRLDPAYLDELGQEFTGDLPPERPFRITFFVGRHGLGYHIGFADIARGGWRTIFAHGRDDYVTVANRLFRENYVLAHTQHLKNKDIYEGGSKMVAVVRVPGPRLAPAEQQQLLHRVQRAFANAFLDVFVTEGGRARHPRVVDLYGEDEPIELGPDENMHDAMIEEIAALSVRRGYLLGGGIMSSKRVGINHKEFGVTSTGVVAFAEIAMRERGVDLRRDRFGVKLTGGPNGDVAGNAIRLLLQRCPGAEIRLVVDGTGALADPAGLDRGELSRIVLRADAEAFDPARLSPGGSLLYRNQRRTAGLRELYRRVEMTASGLRESWVTVDEFHQEFDTAIFRVPADLFIPAGGRPETIDAGNWRRFLGADGKPSAPVIVEGANSFLTPEARLRLQEAGAVVLRDASANKCGVISSSYEIIGNLLLSEREFLARKAEYVRDVLGILERRATDEARLLFRRHRDEGGRRSFTELSESLSVEINGHKARLFRFFEARPDVHLRPPFRQALLAHLPRLIRETPAYRARARQLPSKYRSAILAAEIATTLVYRRPLEPDFASALHGYVREMFPGDRSGRGARASEEGA
ncbi:MAG TPA: NAD-glutamate dehydrogenase domain-containing protein [Anaeromyxobacteraceae bacterium]|nr:NAD-glutamate dehydrogenase domain-containing protein [Anaeromyxobacteraceae bacterium]